jgi:hypothetical protein
MFSYDGHFFSWKQQLIIGSATFASSGKEPSTSTKEEKLILRDFGLLLPVIRRYTATARSIASTELTQYPSIGVDVPFNPSIFNLNFLAIGKLF